MKANTSREASLSLTNGQESEAIDGKIVRVLIPQEQVTEEADDQVIEELSEAFDGFIAFSTDCTWLDRERNLRSGSAVAVEVLVEEPDTENNP